VGDVRIKLKSAVEKLDLKMRMGFSWLSSVFYPELWYWQCSTFGFCYWMVIHVTHFCFIRFKDGKELKCEERLTVETDSEVLVSSFIAIKHFNESDVGKVSMVLTFWSRNFTFKF